MIAEALFSTNDFYVILANEIGVRNNWCRNKEDLIAATYQILPNNNLQAVFGSIFHV